jgi:hypothetical protein
VDLDTWRKARGKELLEGKPVGMVVDPLIKAPGEGEKLTDPTKLPDLLAYTPKAGSPIAAAGLNLGSLFGLDVGERDFAGLPAPDGGSTCIGACACRFGSADRVGHRGSEGTKPQ